MKKKISYFTILCLGLVFTFDAAAQQRRKPTVPVRSALTTKPRVEYLNSASPRPLPFSEAVRVGHMLYLSGKLGTDSNGLVPGGIKAETKQTLENIRGVLERNGSSLNEAVKCTVMLADMSEWGTMNEVYVTLLCKGPNARTQRIWR